MPAISSSRNNLHYMTPKVKSKNRIDWIEPRRGIPTEKLDLISDDNFVTAMKQSMQKDSKTPSALARRHAKSQQGRKLKEEQLRNMMKDHKVIVFQRDVLEPWDGLPRFDFLDCNLATVLKEAKEFESKHTIRKDAFIGNIN